MSDSIDIGQSFNKGWELFKDNMTYLVSSTIIVGLAYIILSIIPVVNFLTIVWGPPLMGGMYYAVRRAAKGEELTYEALLDGFRLSFLPLFLANILFTLIILVPILLIGVLVAVTIPMMASSGMLPSPGSIDPENMEQFSGPLIAIVLMVSIAFFIALLAIQARFMFIYFYIVEDGMGAVDSLKASWAATGGSWFAAALFMIAVGIVNVVGLLGLIIGLVFTIPLGVCMMNAAYEQLEGILYNRPDDEPGDEEPGVATDKYLHGEYLHLFVFLNGIELDDDRAWEIVEETMPNALEEPSEPEVTGKGIPVWPKSKGEFVQIATSEIKKYIDRVPTAPDYLDKSVFKISMKTGKDKKENKSVAIVSVTAL